MTPPVSLISDQSFSFCTFSLSKGRTQKHLEEVQNMEREKLIAKIQEDMEQKAKANES